MEGWNNKLVVGKNFCGRDAVIRLGGNARVILGSDITCLGEIRLEVQPGGLIQVGDRVYMQRDSTVLSKGGQIAIGNNTEIGERFFGLCGKHSFLRIGENCMFSHDVSVLASSGHSILDLKAQENIARENEKFVIIGEHVWLGRGVNVLYNSEIGNENMVGAGSTVKLKSGENCILAGNPARIIRKDCTWTKQADISWDDFYTGGL